MRAGRAIARRDQAASRFSAILMRLCDATAALAAALVDSEGETVDYAGVLDPFEVKVSAAEWSLVLRAATHCTNASGREIRQMVMRATRASFAVVRVSAEYAIVLRLLVHCFRLSERAVAEARREIAEEAELDLGAEGASTEEQWVRLDVMTRPGTRTPTALWWRGEWHPIEVLGRYATEQLGRGETGYRARLPQGVELTLVREPLGFWYADQVLGVDAATSAPPSGAAGQSLEAQRPADPSFSAVSRSGPRGLPSDGGRGTPVEKT